MSDTTLEFTNQLKAKRICRFCLAQDEPLTNIYSTENRKNLRAPLPLQVMACVSIEVISFQCLFSSIPIGSDLFCVCTASEFKSIVFVLILSELNPINELLKPCTVNGSMGACTRKIVCDGTNAK